MNTDTASMDKVQPTEARMSSMYLWLQMLITACLLFLLGAPIWMIFSYGLVYPLVVAAFCLRFITFILVTASTKYKTKLADTGHFPPNLLLIFLLFLFAALFHSGWHRRAALVGACLLVTLVRQVWLYQKWKRVQLACTAHGGSHDALIIGAGTSFFDMLYTVLDRCCFVVEAINPNS